MNNTEPDKNESNEEEPTKEEIEQINRYLRRMNPVTRNWLLGLTGEVNNLRKRLDALENQ